MQFIISLLTWQNLIHLIDILVIWFLIYELLMLIRGTRAVQLFRGILIIILVKIVSWSVGLSTVSWVMDQIINWCYCNCYYLPARDSARTGTPWSRNFLYS